MVILIMSVRSLIIKKYVKMSLFKKFLKDENPTIIPTGCIKIMKLTRVPY